MNPGSKRHPSRCHGVTSLEYVILVSLIAVAVAGALTEFEVEVPQFFQKVAYSLGAAPGPGDGGGGNDPGTGNPGGGTPGGGTPGDGNPGDGGSDPGTGDPGSGDPGSGGDGSDGGGDNPPGGDNPGGGDPGGSDGGSGGGGDDDDFVPDYTIHTNIAFNYNPIYQDWFVKPAGIPEEEWHSLPYTLASDVEVTAGSPATPDKLGWRGVTLIFATPAPGKTREVRLTIGQHKVLYTFTRAASP